jgi:predicted transposase/invertase (TIGR01784 family)
MDDDFMAVIFEDIPCTEVLLSVILDRDDLIVKKVVPQYEIKNLGGRSVRLDIFAVDQENRAYNIEIQRKDSGAVRKRARYNSSLLDAHVTDPGDEYDDLADTYVIFITENDVLKENRPIYHVHRFIEESGKLFEDGSHIIYVNSRIRDDTALGKLMHDFFCSDPNEMENQTLAKRVRYFKESEKGVKTMCKVMEDLGKDYFNEGWVGGWAGGMADGEKKKAKEMALELFKEGWTVGKVASVVKYDDATVEKWFADYRASLS